jgi:hypothetical protein
MNHSAAKSLWLESVLAGMLKSGTWLASSIIAAGLTLSLFDQSGAYLAIVRGTQLVTAGIALFIILPVLRVFVMLTVFLWQRDFRLSAVAAFVLIIMVAGFALGAMPE